MDAVLLGDFDELLLAVFPLSNDLANPIELIHLTLFQSKSVRTQSSVRIGEKFFAEFRMLDRAADDGTNHFIAHV